MSNADYKRMKYTSCRFLGPLRHQWYGRDMSSIVWSQASIAYIGVARNMNESKVSMYFICPFSFRCRASVSKVAVESLSGSVMQDWGMSHAVPIRFINITHLIFHRNSMQHLFKKISFGTSWSNSLLPWVFASPIASLRANALTDFNSNALFVWIKIWMHQNTNVHSQ